MSRLPALLATLGEDSLSADQLGLFKRYLELILRWNAKTNLTAIRSGGQIEERHFLESIVAARSLPDGVGSLLDLGSGAGFPGVPIAICRPEIEVTLAESQGKKAAFLREVLRTVGIPGFVYGARAETLHTSFDCVTLRAVDRMDEAVRVAAALVKPGGWLVAMSSEGERAKVEESAGAGFAWEEPLPLPGSDRRICLHGRNSN